MAPELKTETNMPKNQEHEPRLFSFSLSGRVDSVTSVYTNIIQFGKGWGTVETVMSELQKLKIMLKLPTTNGVIVQGKK